MSQIVGIDISEHNKVSWDKIQKSYDAGEIGFVVIRAGYGVASGMKEDSQFKLNQSEARKRGIPRQFYGYAYPGRSNGDVQARAFATITGPLENGESISLDMEDDTTYGRALVASDVAWSKLFLDTANSLLGVKGLVYMNASMLKRFDWSPLSNADYGLWIASYGVNDGLPHTKPSISPWKNVAMWQYTSQANLGGISPVDANIFFGDKGTFLKYGRQGVNTVPKPEPPQSTSPIQYTLVRDIPGYLTAADASARKNSNSTAPSGTLYVYNQANGMINVTRTAGTPGWWINPADNVASNKVGIVIINGQWHVRVGPSVGYSARDGVVLAGQRYEAEIQPNGWAKISFRGKVGYIASNSYRKV